MVSSGVRVGYARISTIDQNPDRQVAALKAEGIERVWIDRASGKNLGGCPELAALLGWVREGDEVVVASLDRLGRSLSDLLALVDELTGRGVRVTVLSPRLSLSQDAGDAAGRLQLGLLGAVAEFERALIRERQREGIEAARARGAYKGRKPTDPAKLEQARALVAAGVPVAQAARRVGVDRSVLVRAGIRAVRSCRVAPPPVSSPPPPAQSVRLVAPVILPESPASPPPVPCRPDTVLFSG
ncbi:recombinase family protein [Austwickia chelonae]|uniref:recombinase family protein n=1 Tax=Austwickia chelonae TaxID=100225 RepID=UPI000E249A05|nr:recombinase family protein [Austwickia chelonae]